MSAEPWWCTFEASPLLAGSCARVGCGGRAVFGLSCILKGGKGRQLPCPPLSIPVQKPYFKEATDI